MRRVQLAVVGLKDRGQPIRCGLVGPEHAEVAFVDVLAQRVAEERPKHLGGLAERGSRFVDRDRVLPEVGQLEIAQQQAAVRVRVGAHASKAGRRQLGKVGTEPAVVIEQLLGAVALHPRLERGQVLGVVGETGERNLVGSPTALGREAVDGLGSGPAFRRRQDQHWPGWPLDRLAGAGRGLNAPDVGDGIVEGGSHQLVHRRRLVAFDHDRPVAVTLEQLHQFVPRDTGQHGGARDFVAVEMQDRQHRAVRLRIEVLVRMPAGGKRASFGFAVADDTTDQQVGVVEGRAERVHQRVAEFAAFMNRPGRLGCDVAWNAAREGKLAE